MDSSPEVEAKLALPGPVYWRLRDDPGQLGLSVVGRAFERQSNLFHDTADGALRRAGATLRARRISGRPGVEWTHKSGRRLAAGIQTADEVVACGPDADDPLVAAEGLAPVTAAMRLAGGPLRVDAASLTERLALRVAVPSGGEIEVALDRLRIPGDPVFVDYELEAEAHGASRADVEALAADLVARFGLSPSTDSKRARLQAYADGGLGPPRVSVAECPALLAELALRRGDTRPVGVTVSGFTGSALRQLARQVERELTAAGVASAVSTSPDDWTRASLRLWVGSSVHFRLLRHLASGGDDAWDTLERFCRQAEDDRRRIEWRWREADLVALGDESWSLAEHEAAPPRGTAYRPDDLSSEVGGRVVLESDRRGSRLTFTARTWPADLAEARRTFDVSAAVAGVADVLAEVGYDQAQE